MPSAKMVNDASAFSQVSMIFHLPPVLLIPLFLSPTPGEKVRVITPSGRSSQRQLVPPSNLAGCGPDGELDRLLDQTGRIRWTLIRRHQLDNGCHGERQGGGGRHGQSERWQSPPSCGP